jgi:vancomycin resistance protein VanW
MRRLRSAWRRYIPQQMRQHFAQARRAMRDRFGRAPFPVLRYQPASLAMDGFHLQFAIEQPIRQTAHSIGKIANLRIAAARLGYVRVPAGKAISFWTQVGPPTQSNGFKLGRSLVEDRLSADIGGGLCQISGLLYELGLRAGMTIIERHAHSRDLYTEETRFTPLGLDATVVWGYKDVRLGNVVGAPVTFAFDVDETSIIGRLLTQRPLQPAGIRLVRTEISPHIRTVQVFRQPAGSIEQLISNDTYAIDPA